jgi:PKD repeat protein
MDIKALASIIALILLICPVYAATADWTSSQGENSEYLTVSFTGSISGANASTASQWVWNFGDGTVGTGRTTSHTYSAPASADDLIWTVGLSVTTDAIDGSKVISVADRDITLTEPSLHASYTVSPSSSGDAPLTATFTDATFGRHSIISWDFRDGSLTTTQNPVTHTFETPGQYYVKLTVSRDGSEDFWEKKIEVLNPTPVPGQEYLDGNLTLRSGWNFISTPKRLDALKGNNTAGKIFESVDSGGHSALMYNGSNGGWDAVKADTIIKPLDALWIYSNSTEDKNIPLTFDSNPLQAPPSKHLNAGWNTLGHSSVKPATARDTLIDVSEKWTKVIGWNSTEQKFENVIISGGSGIYSDSRTLLPGKGYWVWMKEEGTIASLAIN